MRERRSYVQTKPKSARVRQREFDSLRQTQDIERAGRNMLQLISTLPARNVKSPPQALRFREAFARLKDEIDAVDARGLIPINIDVPNVIALILGALPGILELRNKVAATWPSFDLANFDRLEDCALALGHAHILYLVARSPADDLPVLKTRAMNMRRALRVDLSVLATRGYLPANALAGIKNTTGPEHVVWDLFALGEIARANWRSIAGKTAMQFSDVEAAERLGNELVNVLVGEYRMAALVREASETRQRAFTLAMMRYAQVVRAIGFLLDDPVKTEKVAPTPYGGRVRRPRGRARAKRTEVPRLASRTS